TSICRREHRRWWPLVRHRSRVKPSLPIFAPATLAGHFAAGKSLTRRKAFPPCGIGAAVGLYSGHGLSAVRSCSAAIPAAPQGDPGSDLAAEPDHVACALRGFDRDPALGGGQA